jgi:universal stress protein A
MDKIKKILAPTDLSDFSEAGVRCALELARTTGAEVTFYHAIGTEELLRYSQLRQLDNIIEKHESAMCRFLDYHCADLLPLVEVHIKVEFGAPDISIVEEAKKEKMDLIVISTHGRTGLSHVLLGSITEKVVRHASCPVLSIRPERTRRAARTAAAA